MREEFRSGELQNDDALYSISLRCARALLITRSIEAPTDGAVFQNFRTHFIESGLIGKRFEPVVAAAQKKDVAALNQLEEEIFALLEAVEALYRSMDNSLRFAVEAAKH